MRGERGRDEHAQGGKRKINKAASTLYDRRHKLHPNLRKLFIINMGLLTLLRKLKKVTFVNRSDLNSFVFIFQRSRRRNE